MLHWARISMTLLPFAMAQVLALTSVLIPTPPAPTSFCAYIDRWRGTNVPISPGVPATDIIHAVAIGKGGRSVGWLVFRRDGKAWYFDGAVNGPAPEPTDSSAVLKRLGLAVAVR